MDYQNSLRDAVIGFGLSVSFFTALFARSDHLKCKKERIVSECFVVYANTRMHVKQLGTTNRVFELELGSKAVWFRRLKRCVFTTMGVALPLLGIIRKFPGHSVWESVAAMIACFTVVYFKIECGFHLLIATQTMSRKTSKKICVKEWAPIV